LDERALEELEPDPLAPDWLPVFWGPCEPQPATTVIARTTTTPAMNLMATSCGADELA
jgi:hypothetical protein